MHAGIVVPFLAVAGLGSNVASAANIIVDCNGAIPTIQMGIDMAASGDIVVVKDCVYNERPTIYRDDVQVIGANSMTSSGSYAAGVGAAQSHGAIVDGGGVGGPGVACFSVRENPAIVANPIVEDVVIAGLELQNCGNFGFFVLDASDVTIAGNVVNDYRYVGMNIYNSARVTITGNEVMNGGFSGVGIFIPNGERVQVIDNVLLDPGATGISVTSNDFLTTLNNVVDGASGEGVRANGQFRAKFLRSSISATSGDNVESVSSSDTYVVGSIVNAPAGLVGVGFLADEND